VGLAVFGQRVLFLAFLVILWPTRFISNIRVAWSRWLGKRVG